MQLVRLIYVSTFSKDCDPNELKKIHEVATNTNAKEGISGMLIFGNDYFLQCLEGGRDAVNRLYHKIVLDKRHYHPVLLEYTEAAEREFEEWSMKLVLLTPEKIKLLKRFSVSDGFDPYKMNASSTLKFLLALKA